MLAIDTEVKPPFNPNKAPDGGEWDYQCEEWKIMIKDLSKGAMFENCWDSAVGALKATLVMASAMLFYL